MDSILTSIKKLLGVDQEYDQFDDDIIVGINSALMSLTQIGVGPTTGFMITGVDNTWKEFLGERQDLEAVKSYIYLKTRLMFDPPQSGFLVDAINKQITEFEWRINIQAEGGTTT